MKKYYSKISFLSLISISLVVFIIFAIANVIFSVFNLPYFVEAIILMIASIAAAIFIVGGFYAFSPTLSNIMTVLRRTLRFESLSHPLLLRLSYEAPGTFHHSINVSILAQKAAKTIGADSLLVRVAAYYHDIGKLEYPIRYIENQSGEEIPKADDLPTIKKEAQDIILHVKKGVEIAQLNHLPEDIIDLIKEHHGTTRVLYFFEKAKEKGLKVRKTDFKYAGPKPQTKEAAILMLADSTEAAARAVNNLSLSSIKELVDHAVNDKITDKQLTNCGLTESELSKVKESLIETLSSIYHQRIIK